MGQNDDRRQEGGERDRRAALEIISAEDPMSRSSRNLRDLLKPNAEDVFDCSRVDPQRCALLCACRLERHGVSRGSVRGLPARKLLQRVFNWKSSTSFSVSPPIEEIADSIPIVMPSSYFVAPANECFLGACERTRFCGCARCPIADAETMGASAFSTGRSEKDRCVLSASVQGHPKSEGGCGAQAELEHPTSTAKRTVRNQRLCFDLSFRTPTTFR